MLTAGRALLILALATALYGVAASLYGARLGDARPASGAGAGGPGSHSGRRAVYALAGTLAVCFLLLELAFLRSDFTLGAGRLTLVHDDAGVLPRDRDLVLPGGIAAAVGAAAERVVERDPVPHAAAGARDRPLRDRGAARARGVLLRPADLPRDAVRARQPGAGRGPRAQPAAAPPGDDVPPADAVLGVHAVHDPVRVRRRRAGHPPPRRGLAAHDAPFALAAWLCLGVGIVLGARWSYSELGWGGYWGWDAVENASLMPWLIGTAFLHSAMIQEKRGMLKMWNVSLILGAGHPRDPRHVPRPLGHPRVDPRVRRVDARHPVPGADRGADRSARRCS